MPRFNEDSRVKIPSILHLIGLGYDYLSLRDAHWDEETNFFPSIFKESMLRINPDMNEQDVNRLYGELSLCLENEDLGRAFYERLIEQSGERLIDFRNFENNAFHVVTELTYKKDDEEFRPDIVLLINGMPLAFIEVKKPNNPEGILAERSRINRRFQNSKFRKFVNLTQLMVFSNNMEYDEDPEPIQGAFYATTSYHEPVFNYFREEQSPALPTDYASRTEANEDQLLQDTNYVGIKHSPEFLTNKDPKTPTNRICTSLFSKDRIQFILRYSFAFVKELKGLERHIMRYPQIFATKAIEENLNKGIRKGIIWHTQGSGKTALAYYNVRHLTDYYQKQAIIPKFYFIVDRIDLLTQASREFKARGMIVFTISSKEEFAKAIKSKTALHNSSGKPEITVVNIQKFEEDTEVLTNVDYQLDLQRIYFLDEVHRSYNPKGSFLANLNESDPNAIKIGLTGTPLLGEDFNSRSLFGDYIHKYYYNLSIADGYTLRLIREEIETSYKLKMQEVLKEIDILKGDVERKQVFAHHRYVEPMLDYVVSDFEKFRLTENDNTVGAMVVCDSSDQAKMLFQIFQEKYAPKEEVLSLAAEGTPSYGASKEADRKVKRVALILHDIGTKDERKDQVEDFKEGKIDLLIVYNMLLTGFDAKRLKKLYIGRVIKSHNLLQTLTRVNRTYKRFKYGYVVDFADISSEFDKTNKAYFDELQSELGDEMEHYSNLFKSQEEIELEIREIKDVLFHFDTLNAEVFSQQISQIQDRGKMLSIVKALNNAKSLYNLIRLSGNYELLDKLDFKKLNTLATEANNHLKLINQKQALESGEDTQNLLNIALEDILFKFTKISSEEMILADQLKDVLRRTREKLGGNFDQGDPEFISLKEELERLFKKKNLSEISQDEMMENIEQLNQIYDQAREIERKNQLLRAKYSNDEKYARLHKRLMEKDPLTDSESKLFEALSDLKKTLDAQILQNAQMLSNESFVERMTMRLLIEQFKTKHHFELNPEITKRINGMIVKEYMNQYHGRVA